MEYKSPAIKPVTLTQKIQGFAERYVQATKRFLALNLLLKVLAYRVLMLNNGNKLRGFFFFFGSPVQCLMRRSTSGIQTANAKLFKPSII